MTTANSNTFLSWYTAPDDTTTSNLTEEIFNEALLAFKAELSKDVTKTQWIADSKIGSLNEVLASILEARVQYEARKGNTTSRQALVELSEKIHHYGAIMDILVQHHPEYVSLAWGVMKFLFVGVVNQQNLLSRLSTGLCQIADILPRAELILRLYPTAHIKHAITAIKSMHVIHAITRPAELRYDDLLKKISSLSQSLTEFAWASSHAEQRDLHGKVQQHLTGQEAIQNSIQQLTIIVLEMKASIASENALNATSRIKLHQSLSEVQLVQFMSLLSVTMLEDPLKTFQASLFLRNKRRLKLSNTRPSFWLYPKMQAWNRSQTSSLVMINGTRKFRFHVKDFCTNSISLLRNSKIPVIWALKAIDAQKNTENSSTAGKISTIDILKYLISQTIHLNSTLYTSSALTPRLKTYLSATREEEWFKLLASVLQGIPQLYIIIDIELLHHELEEITEDFSWPVAFLKIFSELEDRNIGTVVKVALVSYGSGLFRKEMSEECKDLVVPVRGLVPAKRSVDGNDGGGIGLNTRGGGLNRGKKRMLGHDTVHARNQARRRRKQ